MGVGEVLAFLGMLAGLGAALAGFGGIARDWARAVRDRLPEPASPPVLVMLEKHAAGRCPVCAQRVSGKAVQCPECRTAAHADCWSYQGGCGIYACARRAS